MSVVLGYGMAIPNPQWTPETWPSFKALIAKAEEFDKIADQPDCIDPEKEAWMNRINERLERLEAAAFRGEKQ